MASPGSSPRWQKATETDSFSPVSQKLVKLKADSHQSATVEIDASNPALDSAVTKQIASGKFARFEVDPSTAVLEAESKVYRRRVKTQMEVPVTRKVKVPTMVDEEIDEEVMVKVKTLEHVSVPTTKEIEEEYVEFEDVVDYELKEIWIKKIVAQAVTKKVEVKKKRVVTVPTTIIKEIEVEKEVPVLRKRIVQVPGFRIDEITDIRTVEVEGWQELELVPQIREIGKVTIDRTSDVGGPQGHVVERKEGPIWDTMDQRLDQVDTDDEGDEPGTLHSTGAVVLDGSESRVRHKGAKNCTSCRVRDQRTHAQSSPPKGSRPCTECGRERQFY